MDPLSAGASVVTFLGLAFSATKTVHSALSTIKDGPQIIQHLNEEVSQLKSVLERLSHISMSATDAAELDSLARKCNDDVVGFEKRLRRLDTSGADGRRGKLWRKLKLFLTEKDLEQIRNVVHGHTQLLAIRLNIIQVQQGSFSATQSAEVLSLLQKLRDDVTVIRQVNSSVGIAEEGSISPRVVELENEKMDSCADLTLDESIERLMRLVERKPCIVDSENAEELFR
ncbi:Helo-like-N domain-containing protein [Fusarium keratoplasticum]|nr:Helo-like-N domain-containing protein [Fusarium keratoplasticum]